MLSDEERKEYIEHEILDRLYCLEENDFDKNKVDDGYIKAVLNACKEAKNLIEKQSKEIEELKEENKKYIVQLTDEQYRKLVDIIRGEISKEWKDKIKAKIEEQEKIINTGGIDFNTKSYARCKIEFGQSLLEKE